MKVLGTIKKYARLSAPVYLLALASLLVVLCPMTRTCFARIGQRWFYVLVLSFLLAFSLTPLLRYAALSWGVLDRPSKRKTHVDPTPLLGGAAVFLAFTVAILVNGIYSVRLLAMLGGSSIVFVVSVTDDIREVPAAVKLLVQLLATGLVMYFGIMLRVLPESTGHVGSVVNAALTVLWIVGITNAVNFFDGMDGLAAGLGAILSFFLALVAFQTYQPFLGWVALAIMGSCLGFLPYNFRPRGSASIFLGDAGSNVIGFLLACLAVYGEWGEGNPIVALASPVLIFWVLIFDMVHITVDRILTGKVTGFKEWIDYVGKDHLHHRLDFVLGSPKRSVLFIYLATTCLGISAIVLRNARSIDAVLLIFQAAIMVILGTILERRGHSLACPPEPGGRGTGA